MNKVTKKDFNAFLRNAGLPCFGLVIAFIFVPFYLFLLPILFISLAGFITSEIYSIEMEKTITLGNMFSIQYLPHASTFLGLCLIFSIVWIVVGIILHLLFYAPLGR